MGVALVRMAYRMTYEHARSRITGGSGEIRRALVLGAGDAARLLLAGIHQQGWMVLGLLDDDPAKQGARIAGVPVLGAAGGGARQPHPRRGDARGGGDAVGARRRSAAGRSNGRRHRSAGADGAQRRRTAHDPRRGDSACATSSSRTCWAASRCSSTWPASATCCAARPCWSPAPAAASAASCAGRSRASGRRGWCCYDLSEFNLYPHRAGTGRGLPGAAAGAADRRREGPAAPARHASAASAAGGVPRRGLQARAADGRAQRRSRRCAPTCWAPARRAWPRPSAAPSAS